MSLLIKEENPEHIAPYQNNTLLNTTFTHVTVLTFMVKVKDNRI